jgi:hypothetical protein
VMAVISGAVYAQEKVDSVQSKVNATLDKYSVDSLSAKLNPLPDSLLPAYRKVDSIRNDFTQKAQSLKHSYDSSTAKIDASRLKINSTIDSLENLKLPTGKYTRKLDSLANLQKESEAKVNSRLADLKSKTTDKLNALDLPPEYKGPVQELTKNVDGLNLNSKTVDIPGLEIPGFELPKVDGLDMPNADLSKYTNLPKIETPIGDLGKVTENVKGIQGDVKSITSGNLNDVKELPKAIENQAGKLDGVQELQKQSAIVDEYKGKLDPLKDPGAAKDKAAEMAKEAAIDHFAGKDQQLKAAMDQMAKYKSKYSSVSSIKDLPKRPPNAMKGKPFIERVVPGLYFQYQQKGFNLFDFNPYVGYRISGRFTAGAGWNQRFARDKKKEEWNRNARIYGPRAYVDVRLYRGFIGHVETELMNSFVHTDIKNQNYELGNREWVWALMTGMKKDYKIYKNLRGTVLIQYNLFNPKFKAPYVDRLNSRIGFEYVLKKRVKKTASN